MSSWRQWRQDSGWRKAGPLVLALAVALILLYSRSSIPAHGQESPLATPTSAPAAPAAPAATFVPAQLPSISGVIHDSNNSPLSGMVVTAYQNQLDTWVNKRQTMTNGAGEFRFPWMTAGVYRLMISDPKNVYASTYFPNVADVEEASDILVAGAPISGLDAAITAGGVISGTLSWPDGPAPFDSTVNVYYVTSAPITTRLSSSDDLTLDPELRQYRLVASKTFTEAEVNFDFPGLAAGRYRVCAQATAQHDSLTECFDNAVFGSHATDVVVTDGATVGNVVIALGDATDTITLTGVVTSLDQKPAAGVDVEAIAEPYADFFYAPQSLHATTDDTGIFRLEHLPYGSYTLRFTDSDGDYLGGRYRLPNEQGPSSSVVISSNVGLTITAALTQAAKITGFTTIDGVNAGMSGQVGAYAKTPNGWVPGGVGSIVAASGAYTVTGLSAGTYHLQYNVEIPGEIYYGTPGATIDTATDISVTTGTVVGNINVDLTPYIAGVAYGSISGQVLKDNAPQSDVKVLVYNATADCCVPSGLIVTTMTDGEGRYSVGALPPGSYKVGISTSNQAKPNLFAVNQASYELAMKYVIGNPADGLSSQSISNVDFAIVPTGSISRTVHRPDDTPVVGAPVSIYQQIGDPGNWPLVASTQTDAAGHYAFTEMIPGMYQVCIAATGIIESTCGGHNGTGKGLDVLVTAGQEAAGIDILDVP